MQKRPPYAELLKSFLPQAVADFQAKPSDEAEKIAVGQMKRGHEYRKNLHSQSSLKPKDS